VDAPPILSAPLEVRSATANALDARKKTKKIVNIIFFIYALLVWFEKMI
jgi:hypothetical protein